MGDTPKTRETMEAEAKPAPSQETADSVDTSHEAAEFVDALPSEASERSSEDKQVQGGAKGDDTSATATAAAAALRPREFPKTKIMKQQVHEALEKEETTLLRQAKKHERRGEFFELNNVLAKVREIRFVLTQLAKDTAEVIKNLWLKYVYNKKQA